MQCMVHVCSPILARGGARAESHAHQPSDWSRALHAGPGGHSRMRGRAGLGAGSDGQARLWRLQWGLRGSLQRGHSHALTTLLWRSSKVLELPLPPAVMERHWEAAGCWLWGTKALIPRALLARHKVPGTCWPCPAARAVGLPDPSQETPSGQPGSEQPPDDGEFHCQA